MRKNTLIYLFYIFSILLITIFLSIQILENKIDVFSIILKKTGEFIYPTSNPQKSIEITLNEGLEEHSLEWLQMIKGREEIEKININPPNNQLGFNDVEWQVEKPLNTYRIIALGDSFTAGDGVPRNSSWPKQLEKKLNDLNLSLKFEVLNMGKGDRDTFEEVELFKNFSLSYNPDMIILNYYPNDWESPEVKVNAIELWEKYENGEYKLPPETESLITELNLTNSSVSALIGRIVSYEYCRRVDWKEEWDRWVKGPMNELINITKNKNIKLIVITFDMTSFPEQKNKLISLLSENQIPFYDFSEYLPNSNSCPSDTRIPDCHLTPLGYEIVANKTLDIVLKII
jgi:hypothetical protein